MTRSHVMLIISSLGGGGAERVISELAAFLAERGYAVTLATLEGDKDDRYSLDSRVERVRINIMWDSRSLLDSLSSTYRRLRMIRRTVLQSGANIVISFIDTTNVRVLLSLIGTGVPVIVSERTDPRHHQIGHFWSYLRLVLYPRAARVVVQTQGVAAWARASFLAKRLEIIPNAVRLFDLNCDAGRPPGMPEGRVVMGMGRLGKEKGFDSLVRAFSASSLPHADWFLVILGEGQEKSCLINLAGQLGLSDRVILVGRQECPEKWLKHADIFALSSRYEGFPNVLIEAMQCGVACVAFDCQSGPGEIIRHGVDGWLVPADDVNALSESLRMLGHNTALRVALGDAAMDVSNTYSPEAVYGKWADLCETCLIS